MRNPIVERLFGDEINARAQEAVRDVEAGIPSRIDEAVEKAMKERPPKSVIIHEGLNDSPRRDADDYAFRSLTSAGEAFDLPEGFTQNVLRWSNRLYDAHGLAEYAVDTVVSLMLGGGLQYDLKFEKGVPEEIQTATRKAMEEWWHHEDVDFPNAAHDLTVEWLLNGEHGWRFDVGQYGFLRLGDVTRLDVKDLTADNFNRRMLHSLTIKDGAFKDEHGKDLKEHDLRILYKDPVTRLLTGDAAYIRYKPRATRRRGRPVLQTVIDELRSEKQFRVLGVDRSLQRMSVFMDTLLEGMDEDQIEAYAKSAGFTLPTRAQRLYHNESVKNVLLEAKIEATELTEMMKFLVIIIASSLGMPPSWFGIGEGANRAIAETQQEPAIRNRKRERDKLFRFFERVADYAIDSRIRAGIIAPGMDPSDKIEVYDETGRPVRKALRECITVNVSPLPLAKDDTDADPLQGSEAAFRVLALADEYQERHSVTVYNEQERASILNWGHKRDGVDITVSAIKNAGPKAEKAPEEEGDEDGEKPNPAQRLQDLLNS